MAKKILADGTVAVVNTKCISVGFETGKCSIIRTKGYATNSTGVSQNLTEETYVLCRFEKSGSNWFIEPQDLRRATAEEKKQWPRN